TFVWSSSAPLRCNVVFAMFAALSRNDQIANGISRLIQMHFLSSLRALELEERVQVPLKGSDIPPVSGLSDLRDHNPLVLQADAQLNSVVVGPAVNDFDKSPKVDQRELIIQYQRSAVVRHLYGLGERGERVEA